MMIKKLNTHDLALIEGGHNFWYYYGIGHSSNLAAQRRNPGAYLGHPNFIVLGGN